MKTTLFAAVVAIAAVISPTYGQAAPMTRELCLQQSQEAERYYRAAKGDLSWNVRRHGELNRRARCKDYPAAAALRPAQPAARPVQRLTYAPQPSAADRRQACSQLLQNTPQAQRLATLMSQCK